MKHLFKNSLLLAITILALSTSCLRDDWDENKPNKHFSSMSLAEGCLDDDFIQISIGWNHSLGLKEDGSVWAWGTNINGALGIGSSPSITTPVKLEELPTIKEVSAGFNNSFALADNGNVYSWGENSYSSLGLGDNVHRYKPTLIPSLSDIRSIKALLYRTFFITTNGDVWGCGQNGSGVLGDGTLVSTRNIPVKVIISRVKEIDGGYFHSIAITEDNRLYVWGNQNYLGLGSLTPSSPVITPSLSLSITEQIKHISA